MKKLAKKPSAREGQGHFLARGIALVLALAAAMGIVYVLASHTGQDRTAATETDVPFY